MFTWPNVTMSVISTNLIFIVIILIFLSLFTREQKERVSLGIFYKKRPFEQAAKYIENDIRINMAGVKDLNLENISNSKFYSVYYKPVCGNPLVENKNIEFCIIRDIAFISFVILTIRLFFTVIWHENFLIELVTSFVAYVLCVLACLTKAKEFLNQIIVEYISKEDK